MIRVVVVDDEPMVCAHLRTILGSGGTIEVVAEAHDGAAGVEAVTRTRPDVVLMDLRMPGMDGLAAIEKIGRAGRAARRGRADHLRRRPVRAAGAAGRRGRVPGQVHPAGRPHRAGAGGRGGPHGAVPGGGAAADRRVGRQHQARDRARQLAAALTEREAEVLACLGEGLSNAQIAARLYLSEATIKGYVSRTLDKLGCANRTQAGLLAHDAGLVPP